MSDQQPTLPRFTGDIKAELRRMVAEFPAPAYRDDTVYAYALAEIERLERELQQFKSKCGSHCADGARLRAMMPLFEEARDALPAIPLASAKLRGLSLDLAARMDAVGVAEEWAKHPANPCNKPNSGSEA